MQLQRAGVSLISDARGDGEFLRFQLCPFDSWDGSGMGVCASSGALPECGDGSAHWAQGRRTAVEAAVGRYTGWGRTGTASVGL